MKTGRHADDNGRGAAERGLVTLRIIWGAMLFTLMIYLGVALLLSDSMEPSLAGTGVMKIMRAVLYGVSVTVLFVSWFVRRRMLRRMNGGISVRSALGKYASAVIVSLALAESIGIYGFLLFLLGGESTDLYFLIALAAGAMIFHRPRTEEVLAMTGVGESATREYRHGERERY